MIDIPNARAVECLQNGVIDAPDDVSAASLTRVADALAGMGWRPISEAPRDGTTVLCFHPKYGVILPGIWDGGDINAFELKDERLEYVKDFYPTHFMPLPTPPEANDAE